MENAKAQALRYMGHSGQELSAELDSMVDECLEEIRNAASPLSVKKTFALVFEADGLRLEGTGLILRVGDIVNHLSGCSAVTLIAATLGYSADRLIRGLEASDITKAMVLDACATQYIEEYCDGLEESLRLEAAERGMEAAPRFSPGYGDFPLETQPRLLSLLDAERKIGLTCTEHLIMIPRKSVTALIGIGSDLGKKQGGCESCSLNNKCNFVKGHGDCGYT